MINEIGSRSQNVTNLLYQMSRLKKIQRERVTGHLPPELGVLRRWQAERLQRTHYDLLHHPRYRPAVEFFLAELYGDKDFSQRDHDVERAYPILSKTLPAKALNTMSMALELNVLSQELDEVLLRVLTQDMKLAITENLTEEAYVEAYRRCDNYDRRLRQIELIRTLGHELDRVVHKPFMQMAVHLARGPSQLAGFGELQHFIEWGFNAFRTMDGADEFLRTIVGRERQILDRIREGHPQPLALETQPL